MLYYTQHHNHSSGHVITLIYSLDHRPQNYELINKIFWLLIITLYMSQIIEGSKLYNLNNFQFLEQ